MFEAIKIRIIQIRHFLMQSHPANVNSISVCRLFVSEKYFSWLKLRCHIPIINTFSAFAVHFQSTYVGFSKQVNSSKICKMHAYFAQAIFLTRHFLDACGMQIYLYKFKPVTSKDCFRYQNIKMLRQNIASVK